MKIAILAPPYLPVPPQGYGGTERIISLLTEGLVKLGHEVTLFASGDSQTSANLVSYYPQHIGNSGFIKDEPLLPLMHYMECFKRQQEFDLISSHAQYLPLFLSEFATVPIVHTWHGSFYPGETSDEKRKTLQAFKNQKYITISNNQRLGLPDLNYVATVYNGLEIDKYPFKAKNKGDYLLWVGRIVPKKGPLPAIKLAHKIKKRLIFAAAVDPIEKSYFEKEIAPFIDNDRVTFIGELDLPKLVDLYQNALCTLYPISWHEPFGLVMIESMACGTPVIAYDMGAVPEIIIDGKTGFVVENAMGVDGLQEAVAKIKNINREDCCSHILQNFTSDKMVRDYEKVFMNLIGKK